MGTHLEEVRYALNLLMKNMEDIWLEREGLRRTLLNTYGLTKSEVGQIEATAKSDPHLIGEAKKAFATMREGIERASREALIEELGEEPPPSGKPN